mmetsp:Transcript_85890/g.188642  ORF Transcript_85890/g.188642 Transcript_85890/m.188642 type:complete len:374 (+) Transcript_85890:123-1244(+)
MSSNLEDIKKGDRVRVQGGRNFEKFHGGMEGTVVENNRDSRNMLVQFDDVRTSGPEPLIVAYKHLELAPERGGYRPGPGPGGPGPSPPLAAPSSSSSSSCAAAAAPAPQGPFLLEHGDFKSRQLVVLHGLQSAAAQELNDKRGRLLKFDPTAERWELDVRGPGNKRIKPENLRKLGKVVVEKDLSVAGFKERGNAAFQKQEYEEAVEYYGAAIDALEEAAEEGAERPAEADDPKYLAVLYSNRAQVYITLCREVHVVDKAANSEDTVSKEARTCAMKANMDAAQAIELDPTFGKAYYRRGCAVLGMAPSASRSKEAIYWLETALSGRASGGKDGIVLPNAMRHEVSNLLDYAKQRLDVMTEVAIPDPDACKQQ